MLCVIYKKCMNDKGSFLLLNGLLLILYTCEMIIPYAFSSFIDSVDTSSGISSVIQPIIIISIASIILIIASHFKSIIAQIINLKVSNQFINEIDDKLENIPLSEVNKHNPAYLNSRIFNDVLTIVSFAIDNLLVAMIQLISTVILFYIIGKIHLFMLGVVFLALLINILGIITLNKQVYKRGYAYRDQNTHYVSANHDRIASIKETKVHGWYHLSSQVVDDVFNGLLDKGILLNKVLAALNNVGNVSKNITLISVMVIGAILLERQAITIGELILVTSYINMCLANSEFFLRLGQSYQQAKICYARIQELLVVEDEENGNVIINEIDTIEIADLKFSYPDKPALYKDFNLRLEKGNIYCIKGENGKGKSTLLNILLGLETTYNGTVKINRIDRRKINMKQLRQEGISVVTQEPKMQRLSVRDNLFRGIKEGQIQSNKLYTDFTISQLMALEDASSLSGGEKQKIAVIRGFLKKASVLILDEPVSAMDTSGIQVLKEVLVLDQAERITILISHNEALFDIVDEFINL